MHGRKRPFFERDKTTLDKIVAIVERTEETTQSQSSKLEFLEETLRETKERINQSNATIAAVDASDGSGTIDRAQISALLRDELGRIEEKIEQVKSISCSLIEEVSESNKNELQIVQENLHEMIMSIEDKMMDASMNRSASMGSGDISSELLNQQLSEVRLDKAGFHDERIT